MSEHPLHSRPNPKPNYDLHDSDIVTETTGVPLKRISWSAVFAGVIVSMVLYLILTILGTAIGATTVDPLEEANPMDKIGTGAAIWIGISMLISIAAGAYISGRLAQREGALHGLLMFGVNTLICVWFAIAIVNSAVTGAMNILGAGLGIVGSGISAAAPSVTEMAKDKLQENNINLDSLQNELNTLLRQTGKPELQPGNLQNTANNEMNNAQNQMQNNAANPQGGNMDVTGWLQGVMSRNADTLQAADRDALKNIIKARTGKSDAEAEQIVNQAAQTYQQARAQYQQMKDEAAKKAREAADKTAAATAKASWFTVIMLVIEAILAGVMGRMGRRNQPHTRLTHERTL